MQGPKEQMRAVELSEKKMRTGGNTECNDDGGRQNECEIKNVIGCTLLKLRRSARRSNLATLSMQAEDLRIDWKLEPYQESAHQRDVTTFTALTIVGCERDL